MMNNFSVTLQASMKLCSMKKTLFLGWNRTPEKIELKDHKTWPAPMSNAEL